MNKQNKLSEKERQPAKVSRILSWYFMIVSTLILCIGGAFVVSLFTIPRCRGFTGSDQTSGFSGEHPRLKPSEEKGLRYAGLATLIYMLIVMLQYYL